MGYGGVVGGGDGEEESEEMMTAFGGFGRRRFVLSIVGRACVVPLSFTSSSSSLLDAVSSMSSRFLFDLAPGKCSRLERGEAYCVAVVAFSFVGFWVELKLNFGAGVNC